MKKLYSIVFAFFTIIAFAQSNLELAVKNLEENYAQEKVYLLFDKDDYIAGDNIWFKSYTFDGYKPTMNSTNLFVELYDKNKTLLDRKLVPIIDGQSEGTLTMKKDVEEGVYYVRAYTTAMNFFGQDLQYINQINIYNPTSKLKLVPNKTLKWNAEVAVEGDHFIENQTSKFAVRLTSFGDLPKKWDGFVFEKNNPNERIASFTNLDENVATFSLRGELGKIYQVQVTDEKGQQQIIDLPAVKSNGILFKIARNNTDIAVQLKSFNLEHQLLNYQIIGTINNQLVFSSKIVKVVASISSILPKEVLETHNGILNLTVFDENNKEVAHRLLFINQDKLSAKPQVSLETNKNPREINTVKITTPDQVVLTSVVRENKQLDRDNLVSAVWLTRDFKSKISNPAQYFNDKANLDALDALLISQKWERFKWEDLLNGEPIKKDEPSSTYLGYKIRAYVNGEPLSNSSLSIFYKTQDSDKEFASVETDYEGNFEFNNLFYYGPMALNYFLNSEDSKFSSTKNMVLSVVPMFKTSTYKADLPPSKYILEETKAETIVNDTKKQTKYNEIKKMINDKSIRLKEVLVTADKKTKTEKLNEELSSGRFKSINEKVIDFVNEEKQIQGYSNIIEFLAGKVAGLTVTRGQSGESIPKIRNSNASIYLDEMPVDASLINTINVSNVAMVKVIKGSGLIGDAIAIYTKRGKDGIKDSADNNMLPNNLIQLGGYNKALPYFSNDDYESLYNDIPNDVRSVLFWNTAIVTEPNVDTELEYYNNDNPKDYLLTIIGFDEKGKPLFYEGKIN